MKGEVSHLVNYLWVNMFPGEYQLGKSQMGGALASAILSLTHNVTICPKTDSRWENAVCPLQRSFSKGPSLLLIPPFRESSPLENSKLIF